MTLIPLLIGIVLAALVFAALLWSIYRAVITTRRARLGYAVLAISTLLVALAVTFNLAGLLLTAGFTCVGAALFGIMSDKGWSKLLPLVQLLLGLFAVWTAASLAFP